MPHTLADVFLRSFHEQNVENKDLQKRNALSYLLENLSGLTQPREELSVSIPEPGAKPGPGRFFPEVPEPTTRTVKPSRSEVFSGALRGAAQSGYPTAAANLVKSLFGDYMGPAKSTKLGQGERLVQEDTGELRAEGAPKTGKPSFGVSANGWLTMVREDGSTEELTGVKPRDVTIQGMRGQAARDVAGIRADATVASAEIKAAAQKVIARLREKGAKVDSPAKLFTHLVQKWQNGEATPEDKAVLNYLAPIIKKQGTLQFLLEQEGGGELPPWADPAAATSTEKPQEEIGWLKKMLNTLTQPSPPALPGGQTGLPGGQTGAPASGAPIPPGTGKAAAGKRVLDLSAGGKKIQVGVPEHLSDQDVARVGQDFVNALKEGKPLDKLIARLQEYGFVIQAGR